MLLNSKFINKRLILFLRIIIVNTKKSLTTCEQLLLGWYYLSVKIKYHVAIRHKVLFVPVIYGFIA